MQLRNFIVITSEAIKEVKSYLKPHLTLPFLIFRCLMIHSIIASACGTGNLQMGQHKLDRTAQTPLGLMSGEDVYTDYRAFNVSYRDTGVFGKIYAFRSNVYVHYIYFCS